MAVASSAKRSRYLLATVPRRERPSRLATVAADQRLEGVLELCAIEGGKLSPARLARAGEMSVTFSEGLAGHAGWWVAKWRCSSLA